MFLSDLFEQLTIGEMSQLNLGGAHNNQGIQPQDYPKVIPHINLALIELYKRFDLKKREVFIQQYDHINTYYLRSKYSKTVGTESTLYIEDTAFNPFLDDVLRIEKVIDEDGKELYVNQEDSAHYETEYSVYTPEFDAIQIPYPSDDNQCIVTYRAAQPKIASTITDPTVVEVNIPLALLEGFLLYVGGRVNMNRGTELSLNEGQLFMSFFEKSMKKVENLNLKNSTDTLNHKLDINGWA